MSLVAAAPAPATVIPLPPCPPAPAGVTAPAYGFYTGIVRCGLRDGPDVGDGAVENRC